MSQILDPERKPSLAREFAHRSKGCLAVIVALAIIVGGGFFAWDRVSGFLSTLGDVPDYPGPGQSAITITVPEGASIDQIGGILYAKKVILSTKAWDVAVRADDDASSIQAGSYAMKTEMPAAAALKILLDPDKNRIRRQVTIPEGLTLKAQLTLLAKKTKISRAEYVKALKKPEAIGLPSYAEGNAEGFLFPDTYELTDQSTATSVLKAMTAQYAVTAKDVDLTGRAKALGVTPYDLVIIASIIEKEVRRPQDRAKVARAIDNRLDDDMLLQLNSTLVYALDYKSEGQITDADLHRDVPYNTYVHKGLPPGPISAPGEAALTAAANPVEGSWIYWVTVNCDTGETKFNDSKAGHDADVAELHTWQKAHPGRC